MQLAATGCHLLRNGEQLHFLYKMEQISVSLIVFFLKRKSGKQQQYTAAFLQTDYLNRFLISYRWLESGSTLRCRV
jgi:hypothetical protein